MKPKRKQRLRKWLNRVVEVAALRWPVIAGAIKVLIRKDK